MKISNWNNNPTLNDAELLTAVESLPEKKCCVRGNGRSYGDASLFSVMVSNLKNRTELRIEKEVLIAGSGYLLNEIMNFCMSEGYFFPVIPGTSYVSLGGMVASDVHGKNHKTNGSIGNWIEKIELRNSENTKVVCSRFENEDLFRSTIGGMGQTGIIDLVYIRLEKWNNSELKLNVKSEKTISDLLVGLKESNASFQVGWFDFLNESKILLFQYNWLKTNGDSSFKIGKPRINVPKLPFSFLTKPLMRIYNKRYFAINLKKNGKTVNPVDCFFPLDRIKNWNRIYGPKGFYQYQCVFPFKHCDEAFETVIKMLKSRKLKPYLTVIKIHSSIASPGILSFPMEGFSIAMDFPNDPGVIDFFKELDELVIKYKGRVYLAKDALLSRSSFEKMYPNFREFDDMRMKFGKDYFTSLQAKRIF